MTVVAFPRHDPELVALAIIEGRADDIPRSVIESRQVGDALVRIRREVQLRAIDVAFRVQHKAMLVVEAALDVEKPEVEVALAAIRATASVTPKVVEVAAQHQVSVVAFDSVAEYRRRLAAVDMEEEPRWDLL